MQTFPSAVTNSMIDNANAAGIQMEVCLVAAFSIYILSLIALNQKQKRYWCHRSRKCSVLLME